MLKRAGRYEILAELGRGGFGQVYRAIDPTLDSMVAIKTLSVDNDAAILARFRNEAAASRRLRHPNIVTIYDFGEQDGTPFIVMELLEGQDLQRVIESRKPLPIWHKIQIMTQIASGLAHAHAHGIVHRDVKPANIMLLPDGTVKIMDFGIALVSQDTQNRLTPRGAVIGTFRYMAPEQFRGFQQDARGDIFAYGLMFYELLSGIHPFHATEPAAVMYNIINLEPVPITEVCPQCPEQVQPVIARLLQKEPEFRYQNLEDVLFDCEPILLELKHAQARDVFEEVTLARGNGQLETAQTLLRQVMELDPSYPGARELREQLQAELRRSAVRPRVDALTSEGRDRLAAGNPSEALVKFEAAVRLDPSDFALKSWMEQAKAALEQSRQVARLVAEAERALESGDLTGAHRIARQAVELAPAEKRAREIVARTGATLAEMERQTRLAADLARARRLIEIRSWDESSSLLDQLEAEFPQLGEIRALREMLEAGRLAEQRQQKLSAGLAAARQEIQGRSLQAASSRLAALQSEFPNAADVEQLLRYVTSELEADRQRDVIDRSLSESRALSQRNRFADAAKILQTALASYPTHPILQRELRSVTIALQQAERDAALNQALSSAKDLQAHGNFEQAVGPLESFSSKYGPEAAIEELRRNIERDREAARRAAELRKMVLHINQLLSQDKAEEATLLLQTLPTPIKNDPEMTQLLVAVQAQLDQKNERRAALDQALGSADGRRQQSDFDQALQILAAFTARYGADPKISELDKSIRGERAESQRKAEERRGLVKRANEFLAQGKAAEATVLLQSRPAYFRDDSEVTKILEEADLQARKQAEREAALHAAISSAVSSRKQGRFDESLALLDGFLRQYGPDDRVAALQREIQTGREAARRSAEIRELETHARSLLDHNDLEAAVALLKQAPVLVNESRDLRELLSGAETALAARQTRQAVEATVADAQSRVRQGELQAALEAIDRGLKRFPSEAALMAARAEVLAAQATKERGEYLARAIAEVHSLIARHDYSRAFRVQEESLGKLSGDPRLQALKTEIEAHQRDWEALQIEQKIQDTVRRARELLQGKPAEAIALLERLCTQNPNRPELITQLGEAREALRQAGERELIREAESLCQKNKFSEAIAKLRQADSETPELEAARQRAESRWAAYVSERIAKGIQTAHEIAERKPAQALRELEKLRQQFPGRPEIESAIEEYRQAAANLATEVAAARGTARRAPLISHPRMLLAAGLIVAAVLSAAVWWIAHSRRVPPAITSVPLEVRTDPDGASVRIGDQSCVTPKCQLNMPPGMYNVEAQLKGYEPIQQNFQVTGTHPAPLNLTLRPLPALPPPVAPGQAAPKLGTLIVQAGTPAALVFIDNVLSGRTDARGDLTLPAEAKTHDVRVEKTGYQTPGEQRIKLAAGATQKVIFNLVPRQGEVVTSVAPPPPRSSQPSTPQSTTPQPPQPTSIPQPQPQVSPVTPPTLPPPDPEAREWEQLRRTDPSQLEAFLEKYPNSPHKVDAQALLDELVWKATNLNDPDSLRAYLSRFPKGVHAPESSSQIEKILDQREKQRLEAEKANPERKAILSVLDGFNAAFTHRQAREVKLVWPSATQTYIDAMNQPGASFIMMLQPTGDVQVNGPSAVVPCQLIIKTTVRGGQPKQTEKAVRVVLAKTGDHWLIVNPLSGGQ